METDTQVHIIESLPVTKAADVLEKMPADEAADILDEIEDEKAEQLLKEMDSEVSQEVRELLEYPDNLAGGLMTTDVLSFRSELTVEDVIRELRIRKPEPSELYSLFVTEEDDRLVGAFSLSDLIIADPDTVLNKIMKSEPIFLYDDQRIDDIAETISKYNLLAVPVVDRENLLQGMVVVDDVLEDLMSKRRTHKR